MEEYIKITHLNDFIFCPLSIYWSSLYGFISERLYKEKIQFNGKAAHTAVDKQEYSTHQNILQSIDVYCQQYKVAGKIDIYDQSTATLTERKKKIVRIYDGYVFQLYAQYFALCEMGYKVEKIRFYSFDNNKVFPQLLPAENPLMLAKFEETIKNIHCFNPDNFMPENPQKCQNCIYKNFCDRPLL